MLCQPCQSDCSTESTSNIYDRTLSSSFSNYTNSGQPVSYTYTDPYVTSEGFLARDMVYYGSNSSVQYTFGCGVQNKGDYGSASGYLGLGPGDFSPATQLGIQNFSYCLGPELDGAIYFGYDTISSGNSTLLLRNSLVPQYYYVNLTGIKVGNQDLDIPSTSILPQSDGSGGMFITTTISLTYLEESAYKATKDELINQVNLSQTDGSEYDLDLCFDISGVDNPLDSIPQLTLHLNGADMVPPIDNYFVSDTNGTILCLAVLPSTDVSVLGTWMQTNFMMFYDLNAGALQFQSFNCSSLD
ncbi:hypothetical protein LUZ60_013763 [Juncus effusus]|nr:hypothetical protein LUZ60_013763 [Juncus effusus]